MTGRVASLSAATLVAFVALAGCGSNAPETAKGGPSASGSIAGTVSGTSWTSLSNAYWIGKPSAGSVPVILFLFEGPIDCSTLTNVNWDKTALGDKQLLEVGFKDATVRTFQVGTDAFAAYLKGFFNPDADAGTLTIEQINPTVNIKGSFDLKFQGDALKGSFDAKYCADGVEP